MTAVLVGVLSIVTIVGCSFLSSGVDLGVPGVTTRKLSLSGFSDRDALVVSPQAIEPNKKGQQRRPLVVFLHGLGGDAESMAKLSGWPVAARDHNLVVAFGEGLDKSWNADGCCGKASSDGTDDVGYLVRLIKDVSSKYPIDPKRVYMAGFSNGAMMTYRFACERGDLLAGAGSAMGTNTSGCALKKPLTFLQITGTADSVVPIAGGRSIAPNIGPFPSITGSVGAIATSNGCPAPVTLSKPPALSRRWGPCTDGVSVGLDTLSGVGHSYPVSNGYSATDAFLTFWGL